MNLEIESSGGESQQPLSPSSPVESSPVETPTGKRKATDAFVSEERYEETMQSIDKVLNELQTVPTKTDDEFDIFAKSIANELCCVSDLNRARRIRLQLQITLANLLLETQNENAANQTENTAAAKTNEKQPTEAGRVETQSNTMALAFFVLGEDGKEYNKNVHKSFILKDTDGNIISDPEIRAQVVTMLGDALNHEQVVHEKSIEPSVEQQAKVDEIIVGNEKRGGGGSNLCFTRRQNKNTN